MGDMSGFVGKLRKALIGCRCAPYVVTGYFCSAGNGGNYLASSIATHPQCSSKVVPQVKTTQRSKLVGAVSAAVFAAIAAFEEIGFGEYQKAGFVCVVVFAFCQWSLGLSL